MELPSTALRLVAHPGEAARELVDEIEALAGECRGRRALVLGLATGNSMLAFYDEWVARIAAGRIDPAGCTAFHLDEYAGLAEDDPRGFRRWMEQRLYDRVPWPRDRRHFPAVADDPADAARLAREYEQRIVDAGGIDLQLLGIGRNGHIGFNEPGSAASSRTRRVELAPSTREDAAKSFGSLASVPRFATTVGVATILAARRIRLLAFGAAKAGALSRALRSTVSAQCPASFLREHQDLRVFADHAAAGELRGSVQR